MRIAKRRRREGKTDYLKRLKMLKSDRPRLVLRKTNRYLIAQYVESLEAQDKIIFGVDSRKLLNFGWPKELSGSLKSLSASYLFGILCGKKILNSDLEDPIIDLGLQRVLHKTRLQAFIKGLVDAGLKIAHNSEALPEEERIKGKNLKNFPFEEIKSKLMGAK